LTPTTRALCRLTRQEGEQVCSSGRGTHSTGATSRGDRCALDRQAFRGAIAADAADSEGGPPCAALTAAIYGTAAQQNCDPLGGETKSVTSSGRWDMVDKTKLDGLILGVDLDGVCADFYGRMREIAAEWFETRLEDLPQDVSFGLAEWGVKTPEQYESLHRFAVTQRELFKTAPMIAGARRYLRLLSNEGVRVRVITHRLFIHYFHNPAVAQTIDWLDTNGIPYWDLCFMKDKEQVGADIYVEDSPGNVEKLRARGLYTICFANSTNHQVEDPRAKSWEQVYEFVHERAKSLRQNGPGTPGSPPNKRLNPTAAWDDGTAAG